jgi:hypothetical protein
MRPVRHGFRLADLRGAEIGTANFAHLARLDQLIERAERVGNRYGVIRAVQLIEVDNIGIEAAQAGFDGDTNVIGTRAFALPVHLRAELSSDDDLSAALTQRTGKKFLAFPLTVNVGGVEEVDARIQRRVDDFCRRIRVDAPAKIVATDADNRDIQRADFSRFHALFS